MFERFRLLPTVMICAALLLGLKLVHLAGGIGSLAVSPAEANAGAEHSSEGAAPAAEGQPEHAAGQDTAPEAAKTPAQAQAPSQAEMIVLESLSARREELEKRAQALDLREQLLTAAEKRVEDRIGELKAIEEKIKTRIADNDRQNEAQMAGLVKMYETMKPKDAARIFERLDMGVLLDVAKRMEPRKMSAVLAAMDPVSAQELTVELATGDKLPDALDPGGARDGGAAPKVPAPASAAVPVTGPAVAPDAASARQPG